MHIVADGFYLADANVLRQQAIQLMGQIVNTHGKLPDIEVSSHLTGMHTCISTTSTHHIDLLAQQQRQTALQLLLHRDAIGLNLPAVIARSVVTEPDKISHSGCKSTNNF